MNLIDLTITWTQAEKDAYQLVKPLLREHLKKVNRVYRRVTPEKQALIREHCSIFDAVLRWVEDE